MKHCRGDLIGAIRCLEPERPNFIDGGKLLVAIGKLIRGLMLEAALAADVSPHQLSFKGTMQSLNTFLGTVIADSNNAQRLYPALLWMISTHRVADRPNRIEPRLLKRRPKPHKLLQEPRHVVRRRLIRDT